MKVEASLWTVREFKPEIKRNIARHADELPELCLALFKAADEQLAKFLRELEAWYAKHHDTGGSYYRDQIVVIRAPNVKYDRRGGAFPGSGRSAWQQVTYYVSAEALRPLMVAAKHGDKEASGILSRWTVGR